MRRILMTAFQFPPFFGSSGSRRALAFVSYLRRYGWDPIVLTANDSAYERTSTEELARIPPDVEVIRAHAWDTGRHFAIRGRYPGWLAVPDRWWTWRLFAVRAGLEAVRRLRPDVVWSTYPITTAHEIAARVAARSGLPWIADIRDPMVEYDPYSGIAYPTDPRVRAVRLGVERTIAERASRAVFVTRGARRICEERYGKEAARRFVVIPNGYDEQEFAEAANGLAPYAPDAHSFRLVHSGTVYPGDERSPAPLFEALKRLRASGSLPAGFRLVLRATGYDAMVAELVDSLGVRDLVEIAPSLPYREALREMLTADALLLIQGSASNPAIPAKLYEYLRAARPMLGLVHPDGDSHEILERLGAATLARHDDADSIERALRLFFAEWRSGLPRIAPPAVAAQFSRSAQTGEFAALLDAVVDERRRCATVTTLR